MSTFSFVASFVSISELKSLIDAGGCTTGHSSPEHTWNGHRLVGGWRARTYSTGVER